MPFICNHVGHRFRIRLLLCVSRASSELVRSSVLIVHCALVRWCRSDDDVDPFGSSGESYGHVAYEEAASAEAAWLMRR